MGKNYQFGTRGFFQKFHLSDFINTLSPIMLQNLKKIVRAKPEICKLCIMLGQNWVKIANFIQKRIFWETSLNCLLCTYCDLSWCKTWKKNLHADPEIKACMVLSHNWVQIFHLTKEDFLENFTKVIFLYFLCCTMCKI